MGTHTIIKNKIKLSRLIEIIEQGLSDEEKEMGTAKAVFQSLIDLRLLDTRKVHMDLELKDGRVVELRG